MVKEYKGALVGESNYQRFGDNFPLLIKFIDACDDLPYKFTPMTNLPGNATTQWERQKCGM